MTDETALLVPPGDGGRSRMPSSRCWRTRSDGQRLGAAARAGGRSTATRGLRSAARLVEIYELVLERAGQGAATA